MHTRRRSGSGKYQNCIYHVFIAGPPQGSAVQCLPMSVCHLSSLRCLSCRHILNTIEVTHSYDETLSGSWHHWFCSRIQIRSSADALGDILVSVRKYVWILTQPHSLLGIIPQLLSTEQTTGVDNYYKPSTAIGPIIDRCVDDAKVKQAADQRLLTVRYSCISRANFSASFMCPIV